MDTIANYAIQIKPLLWIILSIFGGIALQRTRTVSVLIIAIGLWIATIISVLTAIFPYEMHLSNEGELLEQSMGILSINFQIIGGSIALFIIVIGTGLLIFKPKK